MIRIAVVDDHPALRAGLKTVLATQPDLVPVGFAERETDLWPVLNTTDPDLVLLDYHMPGSDGLQVCRAIKSRPLPPRVLLYTAYAGGELAIPAVLAGADGVAGKGIPAQRLFELIRAVAAGERVLPPVSAAVREDASRRLDPEDLPILGMVLEGTPLPDVCEVLGLDGPALTHRLDGMIGRLRFEVEV